MWFIDSRYTITIEGVIMGKIQLTRVDDRLIHGQVMSATEVSNYWKDRQFEDFKAFLLFKSIHSANDAVDLGLPIDCLKQLSDRSGMDVLFQMKPDSNRINFKEWIKK